jgi:thioredoxin reductase (NADPH)
MKEWDLLIVGGGPAGLTAGIYGARSGLKTIIIEEKLAGGAAADSPLIENYPGFSSVSGRELMDKMVEQCRKFGVEINEIEKTVELDLKGDKKIVKTTKAVYEAKAVIIATGSHYRELGVPGEQEFRGRGVSYCAICDGAFFKDQRVIVVGGGNTAVITALYLSGIASNVKLIHRRDQLRAEEALVNDLKKRGVEFLWNTELYRINGDTKVRSVTLRNNKTGEFIDIPVQGIFIQIGEAPNSEIAKQSGIETNEEGYIIVDAKQRTNIPGVFAAGDVTNCSVKQIGVAVGQAIIAANEAYAYIKRPYYYKG